MDSLADGLDLLHTSLPANISIPAELRCALHCDMCMHQLWRGPYLSTSHATVARPAAVANSVLWQMLKSLNSTCMPLAIAGFKSEPHLS